MQQLPDDAPLISLNDLKLLVFKESGYQIQIADDDPFLTTIYVNLAVLGQALTRAGKLNAQIASQIDRLPHVADREMKRAGAEAIGALASHVGEIAQKIAGDAASVERHRTFNYAFAAAIFGCLLCIATGIVIGMGLNNVEVSMIEKNSATLVARAERNVAWMNTEQGEAARNLANTGMAIMLSECSSPGWKIQREGNRFLGKTICSPREDTDGIVYGWVIKN